MSLHCPILPETRRPRLGALLSEGRLLRAIECHDPLSAMLGAAANDRSDGSLRTFDALWASGFTHAAARGLPDAELSLLERRIDAVADIAMASALPIIVDADTGGDELAFALLCRRLEALGASAVIVEDKVGAKRTSLAEQVEHQLEDPLVFAAKINRAKQALLSRDFLVFARVESLIAGAGLQDALARAQVYLNSAADGIVIHSKDRTAAEIFEFMDAYRALTLRLKVSKPLVLIPTAYNHVRGAELRERGASVVIHANHMLRAAFRAMEQTAQTILRHDRSAEADASCAPVNALFEAVGVDVDTVLTRRDGSTPKD